MAPLTVVKSINVGTVLPQVGGRFLRCLRVAPSRDRMWSVQRVRISARDANYQWWTGENSIPPNQIGPSIYGVCAGVWKNVFSPEAEVVWSPCVPPISQSYDPQSPVVVTDSDFLILGIMMPFLDMNNGLQVSIPDPSVLFLLDVDDVPVVRF